MRMRKTPDTTKDIRSGSNDLSTLKKGRAQYLASRLLITAKNALARTKSFECHVPSETVDIQKLISPLRYDVLVRKNFFEFVASNLPLYYRDRNRFLTLAQDLPYYTWFEKVSCARFRPYLLDNTDRLVAAFSQKIDSGVALYESFQTNGFIPTNTITLRSGREILMSDSGKKVSQTVFVGDGCHRLALLLHGGVTRLQPDWYRIRIGSRYTPLDNTLPLLPFLHLEPTAYAKFVSKSFGTDATAIADLVEWVSNHDSERLDELRSILALDMPHLVSTEEWGDSANA